MPAAKKKHISKKTKSSWRKVDVTDVDNFLEEERLIERIGSLENKPDEEIFVHDTVPKKPIKKPKFTARQLRKLKAQTEDAKCFVALENTSKVSDPIAKRNRLRSADQRKHPLVKLKEQKKKELGILSEREKQSITNRLEAAKKVRPGKVKDIAFDKDLWGDEDTINPIDPEKHLDSDWVSKDLKKYILNTSGIPTVEIPQTTYEKRNRVKAIEAPLPGISYNPHAKDYNKLVETVVEKEEEIIRKEENLKRLLAPILHPVSKAERQRRALEEMTMGFPIEGEQSSDSEEDDAEFKSLNPPVRNKKKDPKARRKQKELRVKKADLEKQKLELQKIKDINTLRKFKKEIKKSEKSVEVKKKNRDQRREQKKLGAGRLASEKFEDEEIPVIESPDKLGNLRKLQPEGSILTDRFKSLQKRKILAPNRRQQPKKSASKKIKKRSFKEEIPIKVPRFNKK